MRLYADTAGVEVPINHEKSKLLRMVNKYRNEANKTDKEAEKFDYTILQLKAFFYLCPKFKYSDIKEDKNMPEVQRLKSLKTFSQEALEEFNDTASRQESTGKPKKRSTVNPKLVKQHSEIFGDNKLNNSLRERNFLKRVNNLDSRQYSNATLKACCYLFESNPMNTSDTFNEPELEMLEMLHNDYTAEVIEKFCEYHLNYTYIGTNEFKPEFKLKALNIIHVLINHNNGKNSKGKKSKVKDIALATFHEFILTFEKEKISLMKAYIKKFGIKAPINTVQLNSYKR